MGDVYKTSDILLAACLKLEGHQMTAIEVEGSKGTFVFSHVPDQYLIEYDLGNLQVKSVSL